MSNEFKGMGSPMSPKAKWVTPIVRQLKAGAAELGTASTQDDSDSASVKDNS